MNNKNTIVIVGLITVLLLFYFLSQNLSLKNNSDEIGIATSTQPTHSVLATDAKALLDKWRPERFMSSDASKIKNAIPASAFLRDFELLKATNAFLVLYILNPSLNSEEGVMDYSERTGGWFPSWCGASDFGQTISGKYKLALVRNGNIVNEIDIPFPDFDNWPEHKLETPTSDGVVGYTDMNDPKGVWKAEGALTFRQPRCLLDGSAYATEDSTCKDSGMDFLETRQLQLVDLTGDGLPHEIRFMTEYISCGNDYYVIAGYNKTTDRVMIYPIVDNDSEHLSYTNFDPRADGTVIDDSGCDHGATQHSITRFKFDKYKNAYVAYHSTGVMECTW